MSKKNRSNEAETPHDAPKATNGGAPAGYEKQSEDVAGYWVPKDGPIHCIPRGVKLFDGNIEANKPAILIFADLVDALDVSRKADEGNDKETVRAEAGSRVGIWYKPGMKPIRNLAGVKVWMAFAGEKEIGKPSPMQLFDVRSAGKGNPMPVTEDTRKKSARVVTDFDVRRETSPEEEMAAQED